MKEKRFCTWCGSPLSYDENLTCDECQEVRREALAERVREDLDISVNLRQAAQKIGKSPGHTRRILEHPESFPWRNYGIIEAHRIGKMWEIYFLPVEYQKERARLLINIAEGERNIRNIKSVLGLNSMLTPNDYLSLLKSQVEPLPGRKTPAQRAERKRRIQKNLDFYVDRLATSLSEIANDWLQHN